MLKLQLTMSLVIGLGILALTPGAQASEWNQKTLITFSGPVEIPGQILPAGTYVFKLADSHASRNIVQVFNQEENHIYGTFLAIPDYRMKPADKPIITFSERPADSPIAVKAWFYPGHNFGHEFVYPKKEAMALAKANHVAVPAMPAELEPDTTIADLSMDAPEIEALNAAPLVAEIPSGQEVGLSQAFLIALAPVAAPGELPEELPTTGTSLPLVGLIGLLSLGAAATLRFAVK